jgi:2,3-bisphosphoglycerate-dependent phosphoglycerate mutase
LAAGRADRCSAHALFHSGYQRTIETTAGLLRAYSPQEQALLSQHSDLLLRERDTGYAFDMTQEEFERHFPWMDHYWKTFGAFFAHPPGGESMAQVSQRVALFLDHLYRDLAGKKVLIVSHGGTIRAFRYWLEQWSYVQANEHFRSFAAPKNCAVTSYLNQGEVFVLQESGSIFY